MTYLLDTNILSESIAARPNAGVTAWLMATPVADSYISAITIGEIRRGIERLPDDHQRKQQLNEWLEQQVLARFLGRILAVDVAVMLEWGRLTGSLEGQGRSLPLMDSLMAAQAAYYQLSLVTRNEKDFQGTGIRIVNPWR